MKDNVICHSSIIFNKTAYLLTRGGYANDLKLNEHFADYFLYIKLAQIGDVINHNEFPTLYYRVLSNSMSTRFNMIDNYRGRLSLMRMSKNINNLFFYYTVGLYWRLKVIIKLFFLKW